ncbi:hypothetical protein [Sorangium sp. So ce1078]|uniref:hypothetical protein n=1 Tax=Sorangium sp. So ce1078 TaxID=3133329 RepID=UPI003F5E8852
MTKNRARLRPPPRRPALEARGDAPASLVTAIPSPAPEGKFSWMRPGRRARALGIGRGTWPDRRSGVEQARHPLPSRRDQR